MSSGCRSLRRTDRIAYAKCIAVIQRLTEAGFELRRPTADALRNGIRELRAKRGRVNYRILYFFHGQNATVLAHAITKESKVTAPDIDLAVRRKTVFETNPKKHTYRE